MSKFSTAAYVALSLVAALSASSDAFAYGSPKESAQNDKIARLGMFFTESISTLPFTEIERTTMNSNPRSQPQLKSDGMNDSPNRSAQLSAHREASGRSELPAPKVSEPTGMSSVACLCF